MKSSKDTAEIKNHLPIVAVVVVNWNNHIDTSKCLRCISQSTIAGFNLNVILVDNGSTDDSCVLLEKEFPEVKFIYTNQNLGFARGNNLGIQYALDLRADFVLLLNYDVFIQDKYIRTLKSFLDVNQDVGIVGGKVYFANDDKVIWAAGGKINWWYGRFRGIGNKLTDSGKKFTEIREVDYVPAAALMVRRNIFEEICLLPEYYFLGGEEADFAVQVRNAGYKVCYIPDKDAYSWHRVGYSGKKNSAYTYNRVRNSLIFLERNLIKPFWIFIWWRKVLFWRIICGPLQFVIGKVKMARRINLIAMGDHQKYGEIEQEHLLEVADTLSEII